MKKAGNKKVRVTYNIEESTNIAFEKVAKDDAINRSRLINNLLIEWLKKNKHI